MIALAVIALVLAILFVFLLWQGLSRIRKRKWLSAGFQVIPLTASFIAFAAVLLVISNLTVYQRLTAERDVAILSVARVSEQNYQVTLQQPSLGSTRNSNSFLIKGDEWQLEARILKWKGWANLIGLDSYYQLDRIRGRYRSIEQEGNQPPTIYALPNESRGINLWQLKKIMKSAIPFLDAYYGQAVFLPLKDGAEFIISINQWGLLARPQNDIARQAINEW
jgi:hypothetical protein